MNKQEAYIIIGLTFTAYLEDEKMNSYFISAFFPNSVIYYLLQYCERCTTAIVYRVAYTLLINYTPV